LLGKQKSEVSSVLVQRSHRSKGGVFFVRILANFSRRPLGVKKIIAFSDSIKNRKRAVVIAVLSFFFFYCKDYFKSKHGHHE